jgi:hypothetical protein
LLVPALAAVPNAPDVPNPVAVPAVVPAKPEPKPVGPAGAPRLPKEDDPVAPVLDWEPKKPLAGLAPNPVVGGAVV